jgi:hypothetical protein
MTDTKQRVVDLDAAMEEAPSGGGVTKAASQMKRSGKEQPKHHRRRVGVNADVGCGP